MKASTLLIIPITCGLLAVTARSQGTGTVIPVKDRVETIALAERLIAEHSGEVGPVADVQRDPFEVMLAVAPVVENEVVVAPAGPRYNDRQVLEAIAPRVYPTGSARIGDTDYLLFGQKRLKVGEKLTITYEDSVYLIEITSIERNTFSIRLNNEELVRPIK